MRNETQGPVAMLALALGAALALGLGLAVYLLDRPAGSAWLLPSAWQAATAGRWFGRIGPWLPSFVHAFAFSVLTALVLPRQPGRAAAACLGWAVVDTLAECGQQPAPAAALAAALASVFDDASLAMQLGRFFTGGTFDAADLAAAWAGSGLAFLALRRWLRPGPVPGPAASAGHPRTASNTRFGSPP